MPYIRVRQPVYNIKIAQHSHFTLYSLRSPHRPLCSALPHAHASQQNETSRAAGSDHAGPLGFPCGCNIAPFPALFPCWYRLCWLLALGPLIPCAGGRRRVVLWFLAAGAAGRLPSCCIKKNPVPIGTGSDKPIQTLLIYRWFGVGLHLHFSLHG